MSGQLTIFLLLFGGVQALLFSVFLVSKRLYHSGYIFLLLYFGVLLLQITVKIMSKVWLMENWQLLYGLSYHLPLLYGPLIYLFVRGLVLKKGFKTDEFLHFVPFVILFLYYILYDPNDYNPGMLWIAFNSKGRLLFQLVSLVAYHYMSYKIWAQHKNSLKKYFSAIQQVQMHWVKQFIYASFIVCTIVSITLFVLYVRYPWGHEWRYGFVAVTLFIYWITYTALTQPAVFAVIRGTVNKQEEAAPMIPKLVVYHPGKKYANSGLSDEEISRIVSHLEQTMEQEKLYLDPELTINDLSEKIHCLRHHLSQVINDRLHQSFYDYVNQYRVREAKRMLSDNRMGHIKISAVAYDSGFNSLSTFNGVFKKLTGITPSTYRKKQIDQSRKLRV